MVSTLKEKPNGGFYCSECRMSTTEPVETCPFCGSIISNWMDVIIKQENDRIRSLIDIDPETGKNKYAPDETFVGMRTKISVIDDSSFISKEEIEKIITEMKVKSDENNSYRRD